MKKSIYLITTIALLCSACGHGYIRPCCVANVGARTTQLLAQRDSSAYMTRHITAVLKNDSITLSGSGQPGSVGNNVLLDSIYIRFKFTDTGTYDLSNAKIAYATILGPDANIEPNSVITWYKLDNSATNTLKVAQYDKGNNWVVGYFNLHFLANGQPDVSFSNGVFYASLKK